MLCHEQDNALKYTPIQFAFHVGTTRGVILSLVKHGASLRTGLSSDQSYKNLESPVFLACMHDHQDLLRFLLEPPQSFDPNEPIAIWNSSLLYVAADSGKFDICRILLQYGASAAKRGGRYNTPLHALLMRKDVPLDLVADVIQAANREHDDILDDDMGHHRMTPLHMAVFLDRPDIVKFLLRCGARHDRYCSKYEYLTALGLAAKRGDLEAARELLDGGVEVNLPVVPPHLSIPGDWTALHEAVYSGQRGVAEMLLQKGAKVDAEATGVQFSIGTPLGLCCSHPDRHSFIPLLVEDYGADIHMTSSDGNTNLHDVMDNRQIGAMEYLLGYGLSMFSVNIEGLAPVDVALRVNAAAVLVHILSQPYFGWPMLTFDLKAISNQPYQSLDQSLNRIPRLGGVIRLIRYLTEHCRGVRHGEKTCFESDSTIEMRMYWVLDGLMKRGATCIHVVENCLQSKDHDPVYSEYPLFIRHHKGFVLHEYIRLCAWGRASVRGQCPLLDKQKQTSVKGPPQVDLKKVFILVGVLPYCLQIMVLVRVKEGRKLLLTVSE